MADETLHWTFHYSTRNQMPFFREQLMDVLQQADLSRDARGTGVRIVDRYILLPNYARGFKGETGETEGGYDLTIGEAVIDRKPGLKENWEYSVRYLNTTSGENLQLNFQCLDDDFRTLTDSWSVTAHNGAGHGYRRFAGTGQLLSCGDRFQVTLTVNGVALPVGRFEGSEPVTCNWTLFDVMPTLADRLKGSGRQICLALVEDLEKVRPQVRIGFLENWRLPLDDGILALSGFFVYGEGMLPSYWWLDRQGRVRIASTMFQTFVLASQAEEGTA